MDQQIVNREKLFSLHFSCVVLSQLVFFLLKSYKKVLIDFHPGKDEWREAPWNVFGSSMLRERKKGSATTTSHAAAHWHIKKLGPNVRHQSIKSLCRWKFISVPKLNFRSMQTTDIKRWHRSLCPGGCSKNSYLIKFEILQTEGNSIN